MKNAEINKLSVEDIETKIGELFKKLKDLKMNHKVSPIENPVQIKFLRRDIARLKTAIVNRDMKINFKEDKQSLNNRINIHSKFGQKDMADTMGIVK